MLEKKRLHDWAVAMAETVCQLADPEMCGFERQWAVSVMVPDFVRMLETYEAEHDRLLYIQSPSKN